MRNNRSTARPTLTVRRDPLLGYYGLATVAGRTVHGTGHYETQEEAWAALRAWLKDRAERPAGK
jgi:hypothetical protein